MAKMAHLDRKPFFTLRKEWTPESHLPSRIKFERDNPKKKGEVTPDSGDYGVEFTIGVTLKEFRAMQTELAFANNEKWLAWSKCLTGSRKTAWENLLKADYPDEGIRTTARFNEALLKWFKLITNCTKPRDVQWRHMGNGHDCRKQLDTDVVDHRHRWEEMFNNSLELPAGSEADPNAERKLEWYFTTFCREHRQNYLAVGRDLSTETFDTLTEFMRIQRERDQVTGKMKFMTDALDARQAARKKYALERAKNARAREPSKRNYQPRYESQDRKYRSDRPQGRGRDDYQRDGWRRGSDRHEGRGRYEGRGYGRRDGDYPSKGYRGRGDGRSSYRSNNSRYGDDKYRRNGDDKNDGRQRNGESHHQEEAQEKDERARSRSRSESRSRRSRSRSASRSRRSPSSSRSYDSRRYDEHYCNWSEGEEDERKPAAKSSAAKSEETDHRWTAADEEARKERRREQRRERNKAARREKAKRKKEEREANAKKFADWDVDSDDVLLSSGSEDSDMSPRMRDKLVIKKRNRDAKREARKQEERKQKERQDDNSNSKADKKADA